MKPGPVQDAAELLAKELSNRGCLIEAGWIIFKGMTIPPGASEIQIREMRLAFMAGAQHLFASIMGVLDPGEEPTDADLKRFDLIHQELETFRKELELRYEPTKGRA
jgi:hypothetical protein